MLVSRGGCDKIYLVVIARIKLFGLMRGGVYILVNFLTFETSTRWFSGNFRACAFPGLVYVQNSWSICLLVLARSCTLDFTAYSLGLLLVTAALVTNVVFSEHFTLLNYLGNQFYGVLPPLAE